MSPRKKGRVTIVGALALAALVAAVSLGVAGAGAGERSAFALPRDADVLHEREPVGTVR